jgi:hypothetical protein
VATPVQTSSAKSERPEAQAAVRARHAGRGYQLRPQLYSYHNVAAALLFLNACVWIAGTVMWSVADGKAEFAGKIMFAVSFSLFGLIGCGVGINHFRQKYEVQAQDRQNIRAGRARIHRNWMWINRYFYYYRTTLTTMRYVNDTSTTKYNQDGRTGN